MPVTVSGSIVASGNLFPILGQAGASGYVCWRPGVASFGQFVATPQEVQTAIGFGATDIYIDSSVSPATLPPGLQLDLLKGSVRLRSWNAVFAPGSGDLLTVADTATIKNPGYIGPGLKVVLACTTSSGIVFTLGTSIGTLIVDRGTLIQVGTGADGCLIPSGGIVQIQGREQATIDGPGAGVFSLITAASGAIVGLFGFAMGPGFNARSAGSHVGGTQIFNSDSSSTPPIFANGLGTILPIFFDQQQNLAFSGGATGARPVTPRLYQPFFDSTINRPIWWNGANWQDAAGGVV